VSVAATNRERVMGFFENLFGGDKLPPTANTLSTTPPAPA
jgi:hypothetical protein